MLNPNDPNHVMHERDQTMRRLFDSIILATRPHIICDVGSFDGQEVSRFHKLQPDAKCYAFEANYQNINAFFAGREEMRGVKVINKAVADYDGSIDFNILQQDDEPIDWRRAAGSLNERTDTHKSQKITVDCVKLDTFFQSVLDETFILWIDVEGALDRVIAGAKQVLARTIAVRAEVERVQYWEGQKLVDEIVPMFEDLGFIPLGDTYIPGTIVEQSDIIFLNKNWIDLSVTRFMAGELTAA